MKFYSTKSHSELVDFETAVMLGLAPDGGLFLPEQINRLDQTFLENIGNYSFQEIAFQITQKLIENAIPKADLENLINEVLNFDAPLVSVHDNIYSLELFLGPTLAFKDFGARFMARTLSYFLNKSGKEINILVATSGDTGSAVAHGFLDQPGIKVTLLYPSGKVSLIQEQQLTTMGSNITALEVNGTFDDCQNLVKQAFADQELRKLKNLSSANSINIARLIPQSFYYAYAAARLKNYKNIIFSVPSGNFGNLTAGLIAKRMGINIKTFIAATNSNSVVPEYLTNGIFKPRASVATLSNAMDVGNPSNFERLQDLYNNSLTAIQADVLGCSFSDSDTIEAIQSVYLRSKYIMDPHGAVAYLGLIKYLKNTSDTCGVFLETAHPAKFLDVVEAALNTSILIPDRLKDYLNREKKSIKINTDYQNFKDFVITQ